MKRVKRTKEEKKRRRHADQRGYIPNLEKSNSFIFLTSVKISVFKSSVP